MRFDIYCGSICKDNGKPTQLAACGILIVYTDDTYSKKRSYGYGLGNSTKNLADVQAVRLALASISSKYRHIETHLHTNNPYVISMLEMVDGQYSKSAKTNIESIDEMRRWHSYYSCIITEKVDVSDKYYLAAQEMAENCLKNQDMIDSGTTSV